MEKFIAQSKLIPFTNKTITSIKQLKEELRKIRRIGFSFSEQEYDKNLRAVGTPILGIGLKVIGALALVAPYNRTKVKEVPYYGMMVKETGHIISLEMGGQTSLEITTRY